MVNAGETSKDPEVDRNTSVKKEKSGPDPIIVPIVLKMADFDHKVWPHSFCLQDWSVWVLFCFFILFPEKKVNTIVWGPYLLS